MPKQKKKPKRIYLRDVPDLVIQSLTLSLVMVSFYLALTTISFSFIGSIPPYASVGLAFGIVASMAALLYLARLKERRSIIASLPEDEQQLFAEIESDVRRIIDGDSV